MDILFGIAGLGALGFMLLLGAAISSREGD